MFTYKGYNFSKNIKISKINYFFILEEDFFLSNEIQDKILNYYKKKSYQIIKITIKSNTTWEKIDFEYKQTNLLIKQKILIITIDKKNKNYNIHYILNKIIKYNSSNILLLIHFINYNYEKNIKLFQNIIKEDCIIIYCPFLKIEETQQWITKKIKIMNFHLTLDVITLLSYHYERNLLFLFKILEILKIMSFNTQIKKKYVHSFLIDHVSFSIKNWIYTLFLQQKTQAIRILNFFKKEKYKISHLIRAIQNNLVYLIHMKENKIYNNYLSIFQKDIIFYDKNIILSKNIYNMSYHKIYKIINILTKLEINNQNYENEFSWQYIETLTLAFFL